MVREPQREITEEIVFRRRLLIASRIISVLLILAIFFIGFVQIKYVKEINSYRSQYGDSWSCYVCGLETSRSCSCNYLPELESQREGFDKEQYLKTLAESNVIPCKAPIGKFNLSEID